MYVCELVVVDVELGEGGEAGQQLMVHLLLQQQHQWGLHSMSKFELINI